MESVNRFCSTTTIHGIYELRFLKHRLSKLIFLVAVATSTYFAATQIIQLITRYLEDPTSTSITIANMNRKMAKKFDMTTCAVMWISKSRVAANKYSDNDVAAILSVLQPVPRFNRSITPSKRMTDRLRVTSQRSFLQIINSIMKPYPIKPNTSTTVANTGDVCFDLKPITPPIYSSAGAIKSIFIMPSFSADDHGIQLIENAPEGYVQWILHNLYRGGIPYLLPESNQLRNQSVNHVVQMVEVSRFKTAEDCIQTEIGHILPSGYINRLCTQRCIAEHLTKGPFNCSIPAFSNYPEDNVCILPELVPGYAAKLSFFDHYTNWQTSYFSQIEECVTKRGCQQLKSCETWTINSKSVAREQRFHNGVDGIKFVMEFRDFTQVVKVYRRFSWESLLSNIGGQIGLWLGASMISFLHLTYSILECVYDLVINKIVPLPSKQQIELKPEKSNY